MYMLGSFPNQRHISSPDLGERAEVSPKLRKLRECERVVLVLRQVELARAGRLLDDAVAHVAHLVRDDRVVEAEADARLLGRRDEARDDVGVGRRRVRRAAGAESGVAEPSPSRPVLSTHEYGYGTELLYAKKPQPCLAT